MFSNSGKILKVLAYITFIGGIIGGIIAMACVGDADLIWIGLPIIGGSFITAVACYALGDAQDKISVQNDMIAGLSNKINKLLEKQSVRDGNESLGTAKNRDATTKNDLTPPPKASQKIFCSLCHQYKEIDDDHPYSFYHGNIICYDCDQEKNNSNK